MAGLGYLFIKIKMVYSEISYSGYYIGHGINFDKVLGNSKYAFYNFTNEYDYYYNKETENDSENDSENETDKSKEKTFEPSSTLAIKLIKKEWFKYLKKFHPKLVNINITMPDFSIICDSYNSTYDPVADSSISLIVWGKVMDNKAIKICPSSKECESLKLEYKFPLNSRKLFVDFMARLQLTYCPGVKMIPISERDLEKNRQLMEDSVLTEIFGQIREEY